MSNIKKPRTEPLRPADIIKRVPRTPQDISVVVHVPIPQLTPKGRVKMRPIKLV